MNEATDFASSYGISSALCPKHKDALLAFVQTAPSSIAENVVWITEEQFMYGLIEKIIND